MICDACTRGDHCGPPGVANDRCFCQHRPRRVTRADSDAMIDVVVEAVHDDLTALAYEADATAPADGGDAPKGASDPGDGAVPVDSPRAFVSVLTEWMHEHRAGRFDVAAELRHRLIAYLGRVGPLDQEGDGHV